VKQFISLLVVAAPLLGRDTSGKLLGWVSGLLRRVAGLSLWGVSARLLRWVATGLLRGILLWGITAWLLGRVTAGLLWGVSTRLLWGVSTRLLWRVSTRLLRWVATRLLWGVCLLLWRVASGLSLWRVSALLLRRVGLLTLRSGSSLLGSLLLLLWGILTEVLCHQANSELGVGLALLEQVPLILHNTTGETVDAEGVASEELIGDNVAVPELELELSGVLIGDDELNNFIPLRV